MGQTVCVAQLQALGTWPTPPRTQNLLLPSKAPKFSRMCGSEDVLQMLLESFCLAESHHGEGISVVQQVSGDHGSKLCKYTSGREEIQEM